MNHIEIHENIQSFIFSILWKVKLGLFQQLQICRKKTNFGLKHFIIKKIYKFLYKLPDILTIYLWNLYKPCIIKSDRNYVPTEGFQITYSLQIILPWIIISMAFSLFLPVKGVADVLTWTFIVICYNGLYYTVIFFISSQIYLDRRLFNKNSQLTIVRQAMDLVKAHYLMTTEPFVIKYHRNCYRAIQLGWIYVFYESLLKFNAYTVYFIMHMCNIIIIEAVEGFDYEIIPYF